jgi:hypothetical protein
MFQDFIMLVIFSVIAVYFFGFLAVSMWQESPIMCISVFGMAALFSWLNGDWKI